ncbi:hypothetical protein SUGI_1047050 [Cryptomeria japonica]|nr:hypothetical protein SUGI_1047050 [Cryptomeria japonica]
MVGVEPFEESCRPSKKSSKSHGLHEKMAAESSVATQRLSLHGECKYVDRSLLSKKKPKRTFGPMLDGPSGDEKS